MRNTMVNDDPTRHVMRQHQSPESQHGQSCTFDISKVNLDFHLDCPSHYFDVKLSGISPGSPWSKVNHVLHVSRWRFTLPVEALGPYHWEHRPCSPSLWWLQHSWPWIHLTAASRARSANPGNEASQPAKPLIRRQALPVGNPGLLNQALRQTQALRHYYSGTLAFQHHKNPLGHCYANHSPAVEAAGISYGDARTDLPSALPHCSPGTWLDLGTE